MVASDPRKRFKLYSVHTGESMSRAFNIDRFAVSRNDPPAEPWLCIHMVM